MDLLSKCPFFVQSPGWYIGGFSNSFAAVLHCRCPVNKLLFGREICLGQFRQSYYSLTKVPYLEAKITDGIMTSCSQCGVTCFSIIALNCYVWIRQSKHATKQLSSFPVGEHYGAIPIKVLHGGATADNQLLSNPKQLASSLRTELHDERCISCFAFQPWDNTHKHIVLCNHHVV